MSRQITPVTTTKTVTTHGTPVKLIGTATVVKCFTVQAKSTNTGNIYIGRSPTVVPFTLSAQDTFTQNSQFMDQGVQGKLELSDWYIDSDVDGEGVALYYEIATE